MLTWDMAGYALTLLGTMASLYGAYLAWNQAKLASSAAKVATSIKEQLINQRKTSELSELSTQLDAVKRGFIKYSSTNAKSISGSNASIDAENALLFAHNLKKHSGYFSNNDSANHADSVYVAITEKVSEFKEACSKDRRSEIGAEILSLTVGFSPLLHKQLNEQKENHIT